MRLTRIHHIVRILLFYEYSLCYSYHSTLYERMSHPSVFPANQLFLKHNPSQNSRKRQEVKTKSHKYQCLMYNSCSTIICLYHFISLAKSVSSSKYSTSLSNEDINNIASCWNLRWSA